MIDTELTIINKYGLHARAASKFVSTTSMFGCNVQVGREGNWVDGKSIMSVMMLAATQGTTIGLRLDGNDEDQALAAISALLQNRFGEEE